jgi:hypothetical protein
MSTIARSAITVTTDDEYGEEMYIRVFPVRMVRHSECTIVASLMSRGVHASLSYQSTRRSVRDWEATFDLDVRMVNDPDGKFTIFERQEVGEGFAYFEGGYYQEYQTTVYVVHPDGKKEKIIYSPCDAGCMVTTIVTDASGVAEKVEEFIMEIPLEHRV